MVKALSAIRPLWGDFTGAGDHARPGNAQTGLDSAYYDGQSLLVACALQDVVRGEPYAPTAAELQAMEPIDVETLDPAEDGAACAVRGYAFPLPVAAQDLDALCLDIAPYRGVS